jgi:hypothetical protein
MSDHTPDSTKTPATQAQDLLTRLKAPMTLTLPTWAYGAAGLAALVLLIAALD